MNEDNTGASATWCPKCGAAHPQAEACAPPAGARTGTVLDGKYALVRLLGEGGMGEVYEARHTKIGRRVAVKFLHGQFAKSTEVARRFENEARAAGEVDHENIGGVYDVGALPDGTQYLVMEFLDGEDLDRVLKRERRLPLAQAANLLMQACQGLDVVHRRGIVHRDLKPANLFLTKRANGADLVKVLDFGIAKLRRAEGDASATGTGVALGTPYYMSPEQARGDREIGTQSDVYALGVIFYELLSGRRPHDGDSLLQILHHILTQPPRSLEEVCPELPEAVYGIVRKAMAANAADRFAGVGQLAEALAPFTGDAYRQSRPAPMDATRIETGAGVRVGTAELPTTGGGAVQSVVGAPRATTPGRTGRAIAIAASAVVLLALGIEALAWTRARAGGPTTPASSSTAAVTAITVAPPPSVATAPPAASQGLQAERGEPGATSFGQDGGAGHADQDIAPPEPRRSHGSGTGPSLGNHPGGAVGAARAAARGAQRPAAAALPAPGSAPKPDCTQTYTIDSDGNKHFRPECFPTK